jgi:hypothetical protein
MATVWGVLLLTVCPINSAFCDESQITIGSLFKFAGGAVSAFMIHEGAHFIVGEITHTDLGWEIGNYNQPLAFTENAKSDSDGLAVYSAGLTAQVVASEIILDVDKINKNDAFVRGMMAWNIVNPILYALDYWFIHISNDKNGSTFQGDIQGIEHYSSERTANIFAGSMVALATFQGYRFLKTQSWAPEWVRDKTQNLHFANTPDGGFLLGLRIAF